MSAMFIASPSAWYEIIATIVSVVRLCTYVPY